MKYTLRELRARKDETQAEVADVLGVSRVSYAAWEKDLSNVGVERVYKLANHFGVQIDDIQL